MNNGFITFSQLTVSVKASRDQKGSIILLVMMLLVMMSIIGITSTNSSVTESFITRNTCIHQQNLEMMDAVVTEATQQVLDAGLSSSGNPDMFLSQDQITPEMEDTLSWVHFKNDWEDHGVWKNVYDTGTAGSVLSVAGSAAPNLDNINSAIARILRERGELNIDPDKCPIRYAVVGWSFVPDNDLAADKQRRSGHIIVEYVSEKYGVVRLVIGIERIFQTS